MPKLVLSRAVSLFCLVWVVIPVEKCDFLVYRKETIMMLIDTEMQLVGGVGAEWNLARSEVHQYSGLNFACDT